MKYFLPIILFLSSFIVFSGRVNAATSTQSATTTVQVVVAGNTLSATGYLAPYASIALTINGVVLTSTTADKDGNFSFINISVPKTTSIICFDAVDYKQLGESQACVSVTPVDGVIVETSIFLPPTMGVSRTDVFTGDTADAFGYGMPGAFITVHINGEKGCTATADTTGHYECFITIQKAGSYELFADAVLNGKSSEQQLKKILIKGLATTKVNLTPAPSLPAFAPIFALPWWVWLLLVLIMLILIIILLRRYRPELALPGMPSEKVAHTFDFLFKERKLHHYWMKGIGY